MDSAVRFKVFNACRPCGRQYDVSHLAPGVRVRCACGESFAVEFRQPHSPRALQCSHCGGALRAQALACEWCAAEITLEERRLSAVCPLCYARMSSEARFCMECGVEIVPQALAALPDRAACPRCAAELRSRELGVTSVVECGRCGGLWLSAEHFERVCERADEADLALRAFDAQRGSPVAAQEEHVRYLACVVCQDLMVRRNYASISGVIFDVCRIHGVWLDHGELEKVLAFIRRGGLDRARERELERLRSERLRARSARGGTPFDIPLDEPPIGNALLRPAGGDLIGWVVEALARWTR